MTDYTNIEADIPKFMAQYRKEHPEAAEYSDEKIQYNLDRGWILGWRMARRAVLSNSEPFIELTSTGWYFIESLDSESIQNQPIGTKLFLRPSVPAPQWINVKDQLPECDARRDDTPVNGPQGPIAAANYSLTVLVFLSGGGIRTDNAVCLDGGKPFFENYNKRVTHWMNTPVGP